MDKVLEMWLEILILDPLRRTSLRPRLGSFPEPWKLSTPNRSWVGGIG